MNHPPRPQWCKTLITMLATAAVTMLAAANAQFSLPEPSPGIDMEPAATVTSAPAGIGVPRADAGDARTVVIGETVILDGAGSTDRDGDRLTWSWTLQTPAGSGARLSDATAVRPVFTIDLVGDYLAELVVSDGEHQSTRAKVRISTDNVAPVADAGIDRRIHVGETSLLHASGSSDFNGDALSYRWSVRQAPAGSRAGLENRRASTAGFTADRHGEYVLDLVASDGRLDSAPTALRLSTVNAHPHANAGSDRRVAAGSVVSLDGRESVDPDGNTLHYQWSLLHAPVNSRAQLDGADTATPSLRTDMPGLYVAQLAVTDGDRIGVPDTVVIDARTVAMFGTTPQIGVGVPVGSMPAAVTRGGGSDVDGDGIPDVTDNCVDTFNPDQRDTNGDGFGNICDADLDNDGFITNTLDLGLLKLAFFSTPASPNWNPDADFNGDGVVNVIELGILKLFFFGPPGPIAITFVNPAGGSWHDPANWSPPFVPNTTHTVRIDLDPGMVVEYSTGSSEIAGIRTTSPLLISGGSLSVDGNAQFNDTLTVTGGTLANANIQAPDGGGAGPAIEIPGFSGVAFDAVILGVDLNIRNWATVTVTNDLILDGSTVTLLSDNSFTTLTFTGANGETSTLAGTGEVLFAGLTSIENRNQVLATGSGHNLTVAPGITIRTDTSGGQVSGSATVTIQGTIMANLSGHVINLTGVPLIVEGTLQVTNDSRIQANFIGTGSMITSAATVTVNTGELELFGDFVNDTGIVVTDGTLDIGSVAGGEWSNTGTITLSNATLELGGSYTLVSAGSITGTGTAILNGVLDNTGLTLDIGTAFTGTVELGTGGVIVGGTVSGALVTLPGFRSFTLDDVILSADVNIEAGATLNISNDLTLSGSTITLLSDNNLTHLRFTGVPLETSILGGTGEVVFAGPATIDVGNQVTTFGGTRLTVAPGITFRMDSTSGVVGSTTGTLTLQGTVTANLPGRTIAVSGHPLIVEGTLQVSNDSHIRAGLGSPSSLIKSTATVTVNTGELALSGDFINDSSIVVTDGTLDIGSGIGLEWSNTGTISLSNATLELGGTFTLARAGSITGTGTVVIDGVLDNTGLMLDISTDFTVPVELVTGGAILGGTVAGVPVTLVGFRSFTLDGVILDTDVIVEAGAALNVANGLTLNGSTITLLSDDNFTSLIFTDRIGETSIMDGTGEVVFGGTTSIDGRNRVLASGAGNSLIVEPGITIRTDTAGGQVNGSAPITIQGTITANLPGHAINLTGIPLTIEGMLNAGAGSSISLANYTLDSSAVLNADIGGVTTSDFGLFTVMNGNLDGTLNIALVNGFSPVFGNTFGIVTFATAPNGIFALVSAPALGGGLSWQTNYNATDVTLEVIN